MTRHQRRKAAKAQQAAKIVQRNLSTPCVLDNSRGLVSGIYSGQRLDRARGQGVTPMTHRVTRVEGSPHAPLLFSTRNDAKGSWVRPHALRK